MCRGKRCKESISAIAKIKTDEHDPTPAGVIGCVYNVIVDVNAVCKTCSINGLGTRV